MRYFVYAIFDVGISAYGRPIFVRGRGEALRTFQDEVNRSAADNPLFNHPGDFRLFELAEFDDSTGQFYMPDTPSLVSDAVSLILAPK